MRTERSFDRLDGVPFSGFTLDDRHAVRLIVGELRRQAFTLPQPWACLFIAWLAIQSLREHDTPSTEAEGQQNQGTTTRAGIVRPARRRQADGRVTK